MAKSRLYIVEVIGDYPSAFRFRIIEKVNTVDGIRDRITNVSYKTLTEAQENKIRLEAEANG